VDVRGRGTHVPYAACARAQRAVVRSAHLTPTGLPHRKARRAHFARFSSIVVVVADTVAGDPP
jgi:hypothetical protein